MSFVFLSHRSVDKPRIREFVIGMIDRKIPVWVDNFEEFNLGLADTARRINRNDLAGGIEKLRDWPGQVDYALVRAFAVIVFWSRNWTTDRAILTREHGAAHIFGNVGISKYIPVLLDVELDPGIIAYREAVHDTVQAYNVARYGNEHWIALTETVQKLWNDWSNHQPAQVISSIRSNINWLEELRDTARTPEQTVTLLVRFPPGPAVAPFLVPMFVRRSVANWMAPQPHAAPLTLNEAGGLVLRTFPEEMRKNPDVLVIMPAAVPGPFQSPMAYYWETVFNLACSLGPRMLGALLLSIQIQAFGGREQQVAEILEKLEGWT